LEAISYQKGYNSIMPEDEKPERGMMGFDIDEIDEEAMNRAWKEVAEKHGIEQKEPSPPEPEKPKTN